MLDVSIAASPVRGRNGQIIGVSKIVRDISERKAAQEAVRRSAAIRDQFLGLISHELRTPVTSVIGNASLLLKRGARLSAADRTQALADLLAAGEKIRENVEHLLLLTRLDARRLELTPVSIEQLATRSVAAFRESHPDRLVSVTVAPGLRQALGQEPLVTLTLRNLLTNADKYSPSDAEIEVHVRPVTRERVEVRVLDRGIGLDPEDQGALFSPFYRSRKARDMAGGLGLGLAVCKRALEVQGGKIGAAPRPGGGAEFFFTLGTVTDEGRPDPPTGRAGVDLVARLG
jgi:two-component system sensor histidine kinase KdpD